MLYVILLFLFFLLVLGQMFWKVGIDGIVSKYGSLDFSRIFQWIFSAPIIAGFVLYALATGLWFYILSIAKDKFSIVYPFGSLAYVLGIVAAAIYFKESIPPLRWIGAFVVIFGIYLISRQ